MASSLALGSAAASAFGSSLGAWRISPSGVLELRTSPHAVLKAYFEAGSGSRGTRLWIDLPGAPSRSRSLSGSGAIKQVRIGRPDGETTRLVLEFQPGIQLNPRQLRLIGTAPDRWRMPLTGLPLQGLSNLGEGDFEARTVAAGPQPNPRPSLFPTSPKLLSPDGLPVVPRDRFKVVIDPGHGGPDPGAIGIDGLRETDVVLDVSLQLGRLLQARGVQVLLTRTSDIDVDLPPRVAVANRADADAFISIHANALSMGRPEVNGIESFFFAGGDNAGRSRQLADAVQQQMLAISSGSPDRGVKAARFFVIRRASMPATLIEMGFVTGRLDASRLRDPDYRRRMALALATGILNYLRGTP
ncbi:MAG: N-acetylmuramoyl-L-alanine amidase [Cyanobacteriota bacterium]|nr:N-acetylmuramoyl-L-alanine amidase [Cyanobacteriota bacterium]